MRFVTFVLLAFVFALAGCQTSKQKAKKEALQKKTQAELRHEASDMDFDAFVGRLRKAVAARDMNAIAQMMTPNFGYQLYPQALQGEGVFKYWDEQNLWPEIEGILAEKFVAGDEGYMVAPPQFADKSLHYDGYRAGIRRVNGSWKFIYFVNGPTDRP
jgi:hypothetical protein